MFFIDEKLTVSRRDSSLVQHSNRSQNPSVEDYDDKVKEDISTTSPARPSGEICLPSSKLLPISEQLTTFFYESMISLITSNYEVIDKSDASTNVDTNITKNAESSSSLKKKGKKNVSHSKLKKVSKNMPVSALSVVSSSPNFSQPVHVIWNKPDETSKISFLNGSYYEGQVSRKCMHGTGRLEWPDGTVYMGHFHYNKVQGRGRMEWANGVWYEGEFLANARHGKGLISYRGENRFYCGDWYRAEKHGKGLMFFGKNNFYDGEWKRNIREGFGERCYHYKSGYLGEWKNILRDGKGRMIWSNRDYYDGEWKEGEMHGLGVYFWEAFFHESLVSPPKNIYNGEWEHGKRHGHGVLRLGYINGAVYKGELENNKKHGSGMLVTGNGTVHKAKHLFHRDNLNVVCKDGEDAHIPIIKLNSSYIKLVQHVRKKSDKLFTRANHITAIARNYLKLPQKSNILGFDIEEETRNLTLAVQHHQKDLRLVYNYYAKIGNSSETNYDQNIIRLYLWYLFWECDLHQRHSMEEIDSLLFAEKYMLLRNAHGPFEKIFFCQFVQMIVFLAIDINYEYCDSEPIKGRSLSKTFRKFVEEILLPSVGKYKEKSKLLQSDHTTILAAYDLYTSIGEPHTIRDFIKNVRHTFNKKTEEHKLELNGPASLSHLKPISIANEILWENSGFDLQDNPTEEPSGLKLSKLSRLTTKSLINLFSTTLPNLVVDDRITDIDTKITFFEFFEALVTACEKCSSLIEEEQEWRKKHTSVSALSPD